MSDELSALIETFPRLFRGKPPIVSSYVSFGWAELVDHLCGEIDSAPSEEQAEVFSVLQIKEKLGTLRFYRSFGAGRYATIDITE